MELLAGQKGKKWSKMTKNSVCHTLHISETRHHMIVIYGTHEQNDNISRLFFHLFKILFVIGVKGEKNGPK